MRPVRGRDAAGRPVPADSPDAVEPVPEEALPPAEALALARDLLARGRPFFAHDVLEAVWKAAPAPERLLWQGLAQVCVGLTHLQRDNPVGAARLLRSGAKACRKHRHQHHAWPYPPQLVSFHDVPPRGSGQRERQSLSPRNTCRPQTTCWMPPRARQQQELPMYPSPLNRTLSVHALFLRTVQCPVVLQCQGSDGRFLKPYRAAFARSHAKPGEERLVM